MSSLATPNICRASSRVGDTTITPVPLRGLNRSADSISTAGIRKASVLPEPVFAAPKTSLPASRGGMPRCWISVIVVNFMSSDIAFMVFSDSFRSEKAVGVLSVPGKDGVESVGGRGGGQ